MLPINSVLKEVDALLPLLFNFAVLYDIRRVQVNQNGLKSFVFPFSIQEYKD
jgi:hypothetical protein